jgi:hypothetical protein
MSLVEERAECCSKLEATSISRSKARLRNREEVMVMVMVMGISSVCYDF